MASFTALDDTVELVVANANETLDIDIAGTYDQDIDLERLVGTGAWEKVRRETTGVADATIDTTYVTSEPNQTYRLRVVAVGGTPGTSTSTLLSTSTVDYPDSTIKDSSGRDQVTFTEAGADFTGTVDVTGATVLDGALTVAGAATFSGAASVAGVLTQSATKIGPAPVDTAIALALTQALHAGRVVTLNSTTGRAITLPAATGTGDVYTVFVGTTVSSGSHTIVCAGSDVFNGAVGVSTDIAGVVESAQVTDSTITMNGTTTGGIAGSFVRVTDVASAVWMLEGFLVSSGVEGTVFS
jgi:hypothetical protein